MTLSNFVPLLLALSLVVPITLARVHDGVDRALSLVAIGIFGSYVDEFRAEHPDRQAALRAAHVPRTYREYGSKTLLYAGIFAAVGSILGIYVVWALLLVLSIDPATLREALPTGLEFLANLGGLPSVSFVDLFVLMTVSSLTLGVAAGGGAYWLRWWYASYVADNRARRIEAVLPETVAFVYALSRSGMEFPTVTRLVAANRDIYGAAAEEFEIAVRNVDTFGMDVITALRTMGRRTASTQFREFTENLVSVLQSGHSLSDFLERQYHEYQEESESQQERMLDLLGTLAEAYVTVLVAGPLFLITILVVIGFSLGETRTPLSALIYVILPLGNLAFVIYLSTVTDSINPGRRDEDLEVPAPSSLTASRSRGGDTGTGGGSTPRSSKRTDGGTESLDRVHSNRNQNLNPNPNVERVRIYARLRTVRRRLASPLETVVDRPRRLLLLTLPIAFGAIGWTAWQSARDGELEPAVIDGAIALSAVFVIGTFAIVYELHRRRIEAIEAALPDFLDRLASVNEAGMPLVSAIDHLRGSNLGPLDDELERVWADVQWGADLETALWRFDRRVRTRGTSRVVTLLTEAMNASGNLSTVLRIASRQAAAERRLKRERKEAMLEYMVVVYVSFLVFLFIIAILSAYLLPNLPTDAVGAADSGSAVGSNGLGGVGDVDAGAYTQLFYHATLLQGALSGFIAGQLSSGDVRSGAKHATAMIAITYLMFAFVV